MTDRANRGQLPDSPAAVNPISPDVASALAAASLMLARRFDQGATLWCVSPQWPHHARHVAVEFVHPVIVGKRAVPAVALEGPGVVDLLRANVRVGDVIVLLGPADAPAQAIARRADAWGVSTLWFAAGSRPAAGLANHVVWLGDEFGAAQHDGQMILLYHLLWELTHVCLEQPAMLHVPPAGEDDVCITCSDEGVPGEVISVVGNLAQVRTAKGATQVDVTLLDDVGIGDLVLIHAGTAITTLETAHG